MTGTDLSEEREGREVASVAIIDDHLLLSDALRAALVAEGFAVLVPALTHMDSLTAELRDAAPTVTLLDLDLGPVGSGEELIPVGIESGSRVLIVTATKDEAVVGRCLEAGAWGWVPKDSAVETLVEAVLLATDGKPIMDPSVRDGYIRVWRRRHEEDKKRRECFDALTRREGEVLWMLREGKSVERIAGESFVSEATVRSQVRAILNKLGVNSQLEAVAMATKTGWSPRRTFT